MSLNKNISMSQLHVLIAYQVLLQQMDNIWRISWSLDEICKDKNCIQFHSVQSFLFFIHDEPWIHPTIDNWIVHGVAHCEPVNSQVDFLNICRCCKIRIIWSEQKINILWQPTNCKYYHDNHHHEHNLRFLLKKNFVLLFFD